MTAVAGPRTPDAAETVDLAALGRPISGPGALTRDWRRFWHLTFNLAKTSWKMRFFGSALGYLWQLLRPLLLFGVLYIFFTDVAKINRGEHGPSGAFYGSQLLAAIVLFTFIQEATMGSVRAVVDNEALVRKIEFPRLAIPLSTVLVALFNLTLNMVVVLIFATIQGVRPMLSWIEIPIVIAITAVLATGISLLLSSAFVYFRDIQPIWEVALQVLFYASGVMIPAAVVAQHFGAHSTTMKLYMSNPVSALLEQLKHSAINNAVWGPAGYGGYKWVAVPMAIIFGLLIVGFWVFNRTAPYVAENI